MSNNPLWAQVKDALSALFPNYTFEVDRTGIEFKNGTHGGKLAYPPGDPSVQTYHWWTHMASEAIRRAQT